MIYKAFSSFSNTLLSLPETGMGYQVIDAIKKGSITEQRFIIYNSELIVDFDNNFINSKQRIINEGYSKVFNQVNLLDISTFRIVEKRAITETLILSESLKSSKGRHSGGKGATESAIQNADGMESYTRLSAYDNDKRVDTINKRFIPGTFATTVIDYQTCKRLNDDPIDRYSLPNDEPIKWVFYVRPKKNDKFQEGIVQPAFGHAGGGIEVYFAEGTSNGTYYQKTPY